MSEFYDFIKNDLLNRLVELSPLLTTIVAYKALSTWKKAQIYQNKYKIATECRKKLLELRTAIFVDRFRLSNTNVSLWHTIFCEMEIATENFILSAEEAKLHFGGELGLMVDNIKILTSDFAVCAKIYFLNKTNQSIEDNILCKLYPTDKINELKQDSFEIFESYNAFDNNDRYKNKIDKVFKPLEKYLDQYIKKSVRGY